MEKIRVDGANGLRFSARRTKGCFTPARSSSPFNSSAMANNTATNTTTTTTNTTNTTSESIMKIPKSEINPNKAVFTIDAKTSRILIVNNNACELLGFTSKELCAIEFSNLLVVNKTRSHVSALAEGQLNSEDGTIVLLSGKVVEMTTKYSANVAVSLWIRQIDNAGRCLAVAEPVERRIAKLTIDDAGIVLFGDFEALMLFQLDSVDDFNGIDVTTLIPALKLPSSDTGDLINGLPKSVHKQKATGKTKDGMSFPLCLFIDPVEVDTDKTITPSYHITIWVFTNLSGLMVIDENGFIESCNHHFSMLMFGFTQNKILGQPISKVIPNFGQELEYIGFNRSRNATISSIDNSETETDPVYVERTDPTISDRLSSAELGKCLDLSSKVNSIVSELSDDISNIKSLSSDTRSVLDDQQLQSNNSGDHSTSHSIVKSVSDNLLMTHQENCENNRNAANNIVGGAKMSGNSSSKPQITPISSILSKNTTNYDSNFCDDDLNTLDNEILTPVNETDFALASSVAAATAQNQSQQQQPPWQPSNISEVSQQQSSVFYTAGSSKYNYKSHNSTTSESMMGAAPNALALSSTHSVNTSKKQSNKQLKPDHQSGAMEASERQFVDGKYNGEAIHNDGNVIDIIYTVSCQQMPTGKLYYCVWISRDPDAEDVDEEERNQNLTLTFDSVNSTVDHNNSLGQAIKAVTTVQSSPIAITVKAKSRPNSMSLLSQCEEEQVCGEFSDHYTILKQIGKGAYGYVKMAYRNTDRLLVIAKFILKEKLCPQFMVVTDEKREIPMEIYLLATIVQHPNIVSVHDVYENDKFFQLIMEKHGCGMDLFEFIDRLPVMDEKLGCYIFRQIANAVDYLHSLKILHRDIKDENIIIDQNFHVKLIDFGSATFMEEGRLFSTFYGTTEYCSPEVLRGNKYAGPELEMWSLGVTLYVIMFFENPFMDIEETLHAQLVMPQKVSSHLEHLLYTILDKEPLTRCTMRELIDDPWLNQDVNPASFNFAWVVSCETYESNPEKYYNGQQAYHSSGPVSTSPHDSLSLADADSMLDGEGDDLQTDLDTDFDKECKTTPKKSASVIEIIEPHTVSSSQTPTSTQQLPATQSTIINGLLKVSSLASLTTNNNTIPATRVVTGDHDSFPIKVNNITCDTNATTSTNSQECASSNSVEYVSSSYQHYNDIGEKYKFSNYRYGSSGSKRNKKRPSKKDRRKNVSPWMLAAASPTIGDCAQELGAVAGSSTEHAISEDTTSHKNSGALLASSKSENNLFNGSDEREKGGRLANNLAIFDVIVVSSMRDLHVVDNDGGNNENGGAAQGTIMNDLSKNQVLNKIVSSVDDLHNDGVVGSPKPACYKRDAVLNTFECQEDGFRHKFVAPQSSNRSNFQILSISYNNLGDSTYDDDDYEEDDDDEVVGDDETDLYENDSWPEEDDETSIPHNAGMGYAREV